MNSHALKYATEDEMVSQIVEVSQISEEKSYNDKWIALSDRLVSVGIVAYVTREVSELRYDTSFAYHFVSILLIVVVSFAILSAIDRRVGSGNRSFRQLFLLAQKLLNIVITYFTFILVTLFASAVQPLVDNSFWNFTRVIPPLLVILLIYAAPLLIDLEFYLPLNVAADLRTRISEIQTMRKTRQQSRIVQAYGGDAATSFSILPL